MCYETLYNLWLLSPPVLMHDGLLGVAFCPSVTNTRNKVTRKKFISQEPCDSRSKGKRKGRWAHAKVKLLYIIFTESF